MLCNRSVFHNEDAYLIQVDLPGVSEENINLSVENNILSLSATREKATGKHIVGEIFQTDIQRQFSLHTAVNQDTITAKLNNGVLSITLPKKKTATKISINTL